MSFLAGSVRRNKKNVFWSKLGSQPAIFRFDRWKMFRAACRTRSGGRKNKNRPKTALFTSICAHKEEFSVFYKVVDWFYSVWENFKERLILNLYCASFPYNRLKILRDDHMKKHHFPKNKNNVKGFVLGKIYF